MDILSHTLTGVAIGTVMVGFIKGKDQFRWMPLFTGALGGAMPDLDAISAWSGFDGSLGKFFHLQHSGREIYGSKYWYSHHGFMHSLAAALLFGLLLFVLCFLFRKTVLRKPDPLFNGFRKDWTWVLAFTTGFIFHLLGDLPTPASSWGGVAFWWPSIRYVGGMGKIWWWNNYDIFLIILFVILVNMVFLVIFKKRLIMVRFVLPLVFLIGFFLSVHQISHRSCNFNYNSKSGEYTELEKKSKEIQRQLLGPVLFHGMSYLDNHLRINF